MIFVIDKKVVLSKPGELCQNRYGLLNKDECRLSFETIKKTYPDARICGGDGPWNTRPKGCFHHRPNKCVHWNPTVAGSKNAKDVQICASA